MAWRVAIIEPMRQLNESIFESSLSAIPKCGLRNRKSCRAFGGQYRAVDRGHNTITSILRKE